MKKRKKKPKNFFKKFLGNFVFSVLFCRFISKDQQDDLNLFHNVRRSRGCLLDNS